MKIKLLILPIFLVFSSFLSAQEMFTLCLNLNPKDATVKIDGRVFQLGKERLPFCFEISEGNYTIEIWHPHFELLTDTIQIGKRKITAYSKSLKQLNIDFSNYLETKNTYESQKTNRVLNLTLLGVAEAGLLFFTFSEQGKLGRLKNETQSAKENYYSKLSLEDILRAESDYNSKRNEYEKQRKSEIIKKGVGIPLILGTTYVAWRYIKKIKGQPLDKPILIN